MGAIWLDLSNFFGTQFGAGFATGVILCLIIFMLRKK